VDFRIVLAYDRKSNDAGICLGILVRRHCRARAASV
jgi:hypothetical protein